MFFFGLAERLHVVTICESFIGLAGLFCDNSVLIFFWKLKQMAQFDNVSVKKKANVYFDGKCVSHTVMFPNGTRSTIGVIFPSTLTFNTAAPELMEINAGVCKVRLQGEDSWKTYSEGEKFTVPGNSSFDIETVETVDYVCHFE